MNALLNANTLTPPYTSWREVALHLVEDASTQDGEAGHLRVLKGLDAVLSRLAGHVGSRSLITRAVNLAHVEAPWTVSGRVAPEKILDHLEEQLSARPLDERIAAEVTVVFCLLDLLHTFIGVRLTLQLIQEAWPDLDLQQIDIRKETRT
jgi:hypothetical protein